MTTVLTAAELFEPAPSGVGPYPNVPITPPAGSWLQQMLSIATSVQLPTTSWQPGAPERTILAIEAVTFSQSDANISIMAQGGFLQTAASGTVTYTTVAGTPITVAVTPDPSNTSQNPTGAPGWLDLLTSSVYDVERLPATFSTGPLAIANLSGSTKGPYSVGQYHVASVTNGATFSNQISLTIPSSAIAGSGGVISAVTPGFTQTILQTTTPHGLSTGQSVYLVVPSSSGITGLSNIFALVTATTTSTFTVAVSSSGTYTSGGNVYLCTVATMVADVAGITGSVGPGLVTVAVTQNANVFISNVVGWSGSNYESNASLANRAQLSLAAASPNGPSQAYVYFAETAQQLLAEATPPYTLTNGPVAASTTANPQTGIVTTVVASSTPVSTVFGAAVTPGCAQLGIASISNTNPCVVYCNGPTSLSPGQSMTVTISGTTGIVGVNGTNLGTYSGSSSAFSIPVNAIGAGAWTGGGSVEGGDLGQIDLLLQRNVVPDGITAITQSALALPITITATVVVPQVNVPTYQIAVVEQLQAQIASYAVGGNAPTFAVAYDDIVGALEEAGVVAIGTASYVRSVQSLTVVVGVTTIPVGGSVSFPSNQYQAILATPTISVLGT
jgi:hypothetical protein